MQTVFNHRTLYSIPLHFKAGPQTDFCFAPVRTTFKHFNVYVSCAQKPASVQTSASLSSSKMYLLAEPPHKLSNR